MRVRIKGSVQEAAAEFAANPEVEYAQPNYRFRMAAAANDPYYGSSGSWGQAHADMWGARTLNVGRASGSHAGARAWWSPSSTRG